MRRLAAIFIGLLVTSIAAALTPDQEKAMTLMTKYCSACHAIEPERFIVSESNQTNWNYIHAYGPDASNTWAKSMVALLDWPTDDPKHLIDPDPPDPRWMPIGKRRYEMTNDMVDHRNARQFLLEVVRASVN